MSSRGPFWDRSPEEGFGLAGSCLECSPCRNSKPRMRKPTRRLRRRRSRSLRKRASFSNMALRPQRTFRQRQVESSDSDGDGAEERSAEEPAKPDRPSAGGGTEGAERPRGARGRGRGRGRVWASSRRSPGAASRGDGGAGERRAGRALVRRSPAPAASTGVTCRFGWHFAICIRK